jgi:hypothetical protein
MHAGDEPGLADGTGFGAGGSGRGCTGGGGRPAGGAPVHVCVREPPHPWQGDHRPVHSCLIHSCLIHSCLIHSCLIHTCLIYRRVGRGAAARHGGPLGPAPRLPPPVLRTRPPRWRP